MNRSLLVVFYAVNGEKKSILVAEAYERSAGRKSNDLVLQAEDYRRYYGDKRKVVGPTRAAGWVPLPVV